MKLIYFIPALYNSGGMERVLSTKLNYLVSEYDDYDITVVTTEQMGKPVFFPLDNRVKLVHLDIDFDEHFRKKLIKKYISHKQKLNVYRKKTEQILAELQPDICISLCGKEIEFLYKIKTNVIKIAEIHFSMNFRTLFMSRNKGIIWSLLGWIRTAQLKKQTKKLDKLIVLTKHDKQQWDNTHKNILVISNPNPLKAKIHNYELASKQIISVGRLDYQKGYDMLIDAWKIVSKKHADWQLNIWGNGNWHDLLKQQIEKNRLGNSIYLKGISSEIEKQYSTASFYVMSSRYEGLPMVLIESMSCGLPIVSFDCEYGPGEIIIDGENGFLIPTFDIEKLAEKIIFLIENEDVRKKMSQNSFETAKKYDISEIMTQWTTLFNSLIHKR